MSKASNLLEKLNAITIKEAEEVVFKNRLSKEKEAVDRWADSKKLDRYDDEKQDKTFYIDKDGNVLAAYDDKDKQFHTDIDKEELDRELKD